MTMTRENSLMILARKNSLTPTQAVALPEAITVAARKVGMTEDAFLAACLEKPAVGAYVCQVCRSVTR